MNRKVFDPDDSNEMIEWIFPQIDLPIEADNDSSDEVEIEKPVSEQDALINEMKSQLELKRLEIERLGEELNNKITFLKNIMEQLRDPVAIVDKELMALLQDVIKGLVKKIIGKEIQSDPKLLSKMITSLLELIQTKNGMLTVYLSAQDVKKFSKSEINNFPSIKVDPSLREGDIIIKSNYAEIHAILDERLNKLFGSKK